MSQDEAASGSNAIEGEIDNEEQSRSRKLTQQEVMKRLFMQSKHGDWPSFATEQGLNVHTSRGHYPTAQWVAEKKRDLAKEAAESIGAGIFSHNRFWHQEVLKTLREYPATNEHIHMLIRQRVNDLIDMVNTDAKSKNIKGYKPAFSKVWTRELKDLAQAAKIITEAKHRSLLLSNWSMSVAEEFVKNQTHEIDPTASDSSKQWVIHIKGESPISGLDLERVMLNYYDPAHKKDTPNVQDLKTIDSPPDKLSQIQAVIDQESERES